jgi:hypothetical protein
MLFLLQDKSDRILIDHRVNDWTTFVEGRQFIAVLTNNGPHQIGLIRLVIKDGDGGLPKKNPLVQIGERSANRVDVWYVIRVKLIGFYRLRIGSVPVEKKNIVFGEERVSETQFNLGQPPVSVQADSFVWHEKISIGIRLVWSAFAK